MAFSDQIDFYKNNPLHNAPTLPMDYAHGQNLAFTDTSAQSTAVTSRFVRIVATEDCYYIIGADPTAVTNGASAFLPAGVCEVVRIEPGQKIAAIRSTTNGTMNIIPGLVS